MFGGVCKLSKNTTTSKDPGRVINLNPKSDWTVTVADGSIHRVAGAWLRPGLADGGVTFSDERGIKAFFPHLPVVSVMRVDPETASGGSEVPETLRAR
jgi:hypothetical protein